jgi:hypothetical protein
MSVINYERHSPSSLNLFAASPAMFTLERIIGVRQPVGVPAHRGVAVEEGVALGLLTPDVPLEACVAVAFTRYDTLTAMSADERREKYRVTIPDMIHRALIELRGYGTPSRAQGFVEWQPEGLKLPIVGIFDFEFADSGVIVDLKTTERMPFEVKIPHAWQVALYVAATRNNYEGRLSYVTPKKAATYRLENMPEHLKALHQIALRVENFLSLSDDPEFFKSITVPDLESFYWTSPAARQLAYELWKI